MSVNLIVANTFAHARAVAQKLSGAQKGILMDTSHVARYKIIDLARKSPEFVWIYVPVHIFQRCFGYNRDKSCVYVAKGSRLHMFAYNYLRTQFINVKVINYATA